MTLPFSRKLLLLGIDIEATGGNLNINCPYALASIIVDGRSNEVVTSFFQVCKPDHDCEWDADTYRHFMQDTTENWRNLVLGVFYNETSSGPQMMVQSWYQWLVNSLKELDYNPRTHNLLPIVDTTFFDKSMIGVYLPLECKGMDYLTGEFNPWNDIRMYYAGLARIDISSGRYTAKQLFDIILSQNQQLNLEDYIDEDSVAHDHNPLNDVKCIVFEFNKLRRALDLSY